MELKNFQVGEMRKVGAGVVLRIVSVPSAASPRGHGQKSW
jgi:hypothetical protein